MFSRKEFITISDVRELSRIVCVFIKLLPLMDKYIPNARELNVCQYGKKANFHSNK